MRARGSVCSDLMFAWYALDQTVESELEAVDISVVWRMHLVRGVSGEKVCELARCRSLLLPAPGGDTLSVYNAEHAHRLELPAQTSASLAQYK